MAKRTSYGIASDLFIERGPDSIIGSPSIKEAQIYSGQTVKFLATLAALYQEHVPASEVELSRQVSSLLEFANRITDIALTAIGFTAEYAKRYPDGDTSAAEFGASILAMQLKKTLEIDTRTKEADAIFSSRKEKD